MWALMQLSSGIRKPAVKAEWGPEGWRPKVAAHRGDAATGTLQMCFRRRKETGCGQGGKHNHRAWQLTAATPRVWVPPEEDMQPGQDFSLRSFLAK